MDPLPQPDSEELRELVKDARARAVYKVLFDTREEPLTMLEIRGRLAGTLVPQEQLDRRKRDLHPYFRIERIRKGKETRYRLAGRKPRLTGLDARISEKDRAIILRYGRCAMCGRRALEDGVTLQVDHKIPQDWGGTSHLDNLQPLCEECNRGKKNLFSSYSEHAAAIRHALNSESPHKRIGEFLKAVHPEWVRSDAIDLVASPPGDAQEDWQRRMRELRDIGWNYEYRRGHEDGRVRTYYRLTAWKPWPKGPRRRKKKKS